MHTIVRHTVGTTVQAPTAFFDVPGSLANHHPNPGWPSVKNHAFHDLFTPRPGSRNKHDIAMTKSVFGHSASVLGFKDKNVFTEKTTLRASFQIKKRQTGHQKALLGPSFPSFLDLLCFVFKFLPNEVGHTNKMVLTPAPPVREGLIFRHWRLRNIRIVHPFYRTLAPHASTTCSPFIIIWIQNDMENERETLILKHEIHRRRNGWVKVFGRKKKEKDTVGVACPYCEYNNPIGSTTCEQCYYELDKSARNQPMATPTTSGDEIMSMLLAENEDDEEEGVQVVEAVLSMDEITVEVDQYSLGQPTHDEDGEPQPESFEFIGSEGPTLSETVASVEDDEPTELTIEDAPKQYIEFELETVDPLSEVAEPVHTGKGGLYSPTVPTANDDDLLGDVGPAPTDATPDLPDLPDDSPASAPLAQAAVMETAASSPTPELPELPGEEETISEATAAQEPEAAPVQDDRIWPWPKAEPWTPTQVYQEVVAAMEHVKHGRMEQAASTLDGLGPHLDLNLDMLLHISVLMQHLGRHDHVKWTLDMAAYVHPNDAHVQQARAQLLV
jgi:hypothetical protein